MKSPNSKSALDWKKKADEGDIDAIMQYAEMLFIGFGALISKEEAFNVIKSSQKAVHFAYSPSGRRIRHI